MTSLLAGIGVHVVLSAIFGIIFALLMALLRQVDASTGVLLAWGLVYGTALWVVNFLLIAPVAFPQFTEVNQLWNGFFAHAFFYGLPIGAYMAAVKSRLM